MIKRYLIKLNGNEINTIRQLQDSEGNYYNIELIDTTTKELFKIDGTITKFKTETRFGYTAWVLDVSALKYVRSGNGELFESRIILERFYYRKAGDEYTLGFAVPYS